jgi:hypothetical protein
MEYLVISLLSLLAIVVVVYRQMATRPTANRGILYTAAAMIIFGTISGGLVDTRHLWVSVALVLVEAAAAVALGVWRATTVRVWTDRSGVTWSKATGWTLLVWLVSVAVRVGLYFTGAALGLTMTTGGVLVFLGLTVGVQSYLVMRRGQALTHTGVPADTFVG